MFIGHYGVGLAGKAIDTRPSLGTMFLAAQWLDLLWPVFVLAGLEKFSIVPGNTVLTPLRFDYYPWSHSMLMAINWGVLLAIIYFISTKNARGGILIGFLVFSHWLLDWFVHAADLQLTPFSQTRVGLELWNYKWPEIILESLIFVAGAVIYLKRTSAKNKTGKWVVWALFIFLVVVHFMNTFGPPPTDIQMVAWVGLSQWLLVAWGYWVDRNRSSSLQPLHSKPL
ncbi:MAG TPA: metal-dependent hydrolase [Chitinophagaceae bacterium]|nr:metal-dependent hydrolase [Chitinophagaceae bacterium]